MKSALCSYGILILVLVMCFVVVDGSVPSGLAQEKDPSKHSEFESEEQLSWEVSEIKLPAFTQEKKGMKSGKFGKRAMNNGGAWFPKRGSKREALGELSFPVIRIQQGDFTVEILPENASVVSRVYEKDGTDWFFNEQRIKDWIPWWESGVKATFPFMEHGMRERQPSAWQVIKEDEKTVRFSSWMEFSRHHAIKESVQFGRHSNMILEQNVVVKAGDPRLQIIYRVTNPTPYKQGLQCWNDALWPRYHHPGGVEHGKSKIAHPDDVELFGAMDWASDHRGEKFKAFHVDEHNPRLPGKYAYSFFVWDVQYGWTGLYYPSVDVARIRLVDPQKAPGTKWWWRTPNVRDDVNHNFIEMWGGTDHVFEGVERWLKPGHQWEATWTFLYLTGIGKPIIANDKAVIGLRGTRLAAVTLDPTQEVELWVDGQKVAEGSSNHQQAIDTQLSETQAKAFTAELRVKGEVIAQAEFPRKPLPLRPEMKKQIEDSLNYDIKVGSEMQGNQQTRGRFYRNAKYAGNTLGYARVSIRDGRLERAVKSLKAVIEKDPENGEAWHLLGLCYAEQGKVDEAMTALERALSVENKEPEAGYLLAVMSLKKSDPVNARLLLDQLLSKAPQHFEAALLRAYLAEDAADAERMTKLAEKHPADPRVIWAVMQLNQRLGNDIQGHEKVFKQLLKQEPGAKARVDQFKAITEGRYVHPQRLDAEVW